MTTPHLNGPGPLQAMHLKNLKGLLYLRQDILDEFLHKLVGITELRQVASAFESNKGFLRSMDAGKVRLGGSCRSKNVSLTLENEKREIKSITKRVEVKSHHFLKELLG